MVAMALPVWGQRQSAPPPTPPGDRNGLGTAPADEDDASARLAHDMAKKANLERHAAIKNDTEKLLKLAVELKASVDKSNENLLSMDVVKKAEEIEKLAHSVRDKMKGPN
jgi:nitric oxide reductase activation protein